MVHVAVPRGSRLVSSVQHTLYACFVINGGLGFNLSKHAFDM